MGHKKAIVIFRIFLLSICILNFKYSSGQCPNLSFSKIKSIFLSDNKEDLLLEEGFTKDIPKGLLVELSYNKCIKVVCRRGDSVAKSPSERFLIFKDGDVNYATYDRQAYLLAKKNIKTKAKYISSDYVYESIKREYYFDGKYYYGFYVYVDDCFDNTIINSYKIEFRKKKPVVQVDK